MMMCQDRVYHYHVRTLETLVPKCVNSLETLFTWPASQPATPPDLVTSLNSWYMQLLQYETVGNVYSNCILYRIISMGIYISRLLCLLLYVQWQALWGVGRKAS